ncbi:MAG: glycosyltransferase [Desulfobacterales bacterium]
MARNSTYNILMYSHDTYGLGHIRRSMAIASHLLGPRVNILILTGSPIAGRFSFPEQIDFVRIPGMIKRTNEEYLPLSIKINARHALDIRKNIITATVKTFQPQLFIVDKEPLGLKREVLPALQWLKRNRPGTRTILGLRDIMDDAETTRREWRQKGVYQILEELYSEIWIYGNRDMYDPVAEYAIDEGASRKVVFTGYIPRKVPSAENVQGIRKEHGLGEEDKLVVVTTGGGGDGYAVMDAYLRMLETSPGLPPFKSILITGPFMPKSERKSAYKRSRKLGVRMYHFYRQMEKIFAAADVVVSMGGYNTLSEILNQGTVSLVIPRETPRREQLIRAQTFKRRNLTDFIPWDELSPDRLRDHLLVLLANPAPYREAIAGFRFTGIETMQQRILEFRDRKP